MKTLITTYNKLDEFLEEFVEGYLDLMLVKGPGGTGKSQRLKPYVDSGQISLLLGATMTPFDLYCKLYRMRDRPIVIDDIDSLWKNPQTVNLLKLLCQTDEVKSLAWNSAKLGNPTSTESVVPVDAVVDAEDTDECEDGCEPHGNDNGPVPNRFTTRSRIMVIANSWHVKDENLAALMTRGVDLTFDPTGLEIHREAASFCKDQEVYEFLGAWARTAKINFRDYVKAEKLNQRKRIDWRQLLLQQWQVSEAMMFVEKLENDPVWKNRPWQDKVAEFAAQDFPEGISKSRYYELRNLLLHGRAESSRRPQSALDQALGDLDAGVESVECQELMA